MTYYRPATARDTPHHSDRKHDITKPWVRLHTDSYLVPNVVYESLPTNSVWSPAEHAILQESFWPENFGHSMGDDFFSAYHLARSFGVWDRSDIQLIMHPACWDRGYKERGCANHAQFGPYILDRPFETFNSTLFASNEGGRVCFRNLYTGMRYLGTGFPSEDMLPPFIDELRVTSGLDPSRRPRRQRITVFLKSGRRVFLNNEALVDHLRRRFEVEVDLMNPADLSISEHLAYLQDTTVIVSPCGSLSMGGLFLPKGTSMVVADYWHMEDKVYNDTMPMAPYIFNNNNDVTTYYYPLKFEDVQLDESAVPDWEGKSQLLHYRNWANVTIDLERMESYVFSALLAAEVSQGWQHSFKL